VVCQLLGLSVTWLCCAKTAERIEIFLGLETFGYQRHIVLDVSSAEQVHLQPVLERNDAGDLSSSHSSNQPNTRAGGQPGGQATRHTPRCPKTPAGPAGPTGRAATSQVEIAVHIVGRRWRSEVS